MCPSAKKRKPFLSQHVHEGNGFSVCQCGICVCSRGAGRLLLTKAGNDHGTTPFTDLTANWYKTAILWAYQNNVVAGKSPTTFDPEGPVTREQIAVILTEYMFNVLKMNRTWTPADLSTFPDGAQVSSWAKEAMQDAVALGLINGTKAPDGLVYLDPQGSAARQQVATILMNFCQNVKK